MRTTNRFEDLDNQALIDARLAMRICPRCGHDLIPVALLDQVYGCAGDNYPEHEFETWYLGGEGGSS